MLFINETDTSHNELLDDLLMCLHEAGHAAVAHALDVGLDSVEIYPQPRVVFTKTWGRLYNRDLGRGALTRTLAVNVVITAAGAAAETRYCRTNNLPVRTLESGFNDMHQIGKVAHFIYEDGRHDAALRRFACRRAARIVADPIVWTAICDMADALYYDHTTVPGATAMAMLRRSGLKRGAALR